MSPTDESSPSAKLRTLLRGFPEPTVEACARFQADGDDVAFNEAVCGVIQHFLDQPPTTAVSAMPGTTKLVDDLRLDSLTMVEMVFLLEDLFGTDIPQTELAGIATLDDLRMLLRHRLPARR